LKKPRRFRVCKCACNDRISLGKKAPLRINVRDDLFAELLFAGRNAPSTELLSKPFALLDDNQQSGDHQLNKAAENAGVRKSMTPSQGLARCLSLIVKTRARSQEKLIDQILLHYAFTLSPYVEATAVGICTIQFTDNRKLTPKLSRVIEQLGQCEIIAQGGLQLRQILVFSSRN